MSGSPEGIYEPGIVDPGVPVPHPTQSFWLSSPHPLANHQSPWPTHAVDIAIIGSGITGTNIARTLLQKQPNLRIVVLEARSLCSGATGRNGGHIKTMSFASWKQRKEAYGIEEAVRITKFEHSHLDTLERAARENGIDCDLVRTEGVDAYFDQATFDCARAALDDMRAHAPEQAAKYTVYTNPDRLHRVMKLSPRCVGAIGVPAASVWPYKLVTGLMARMIESGKLNVQTQTAVTSIDDDDNTDFAAVHTTRGTIRARHVVHATNGWLGHLLPELRPFVSPVRGNVVRYAPSSSPSPSASAETNASSASPFALSPTFSFWLRYATHDYDYLIQRRSRRITTRDGSICASAPLKPPDRASNSGHRQWGRRPPALTSHLQHRPISRQQLTSFIAANFYLIISAVLDSQSHCPFFLPHLHLFLHPLITMKAIQLTEYVKGPADLKVSDLPDPVPENDEYLIEVHSAATNFFDILQIQGKYQNQPPFPWIAGAEFAGVVLSTPSGYENPRFPVGARVFGSAQGAYASKCVAKELSMLPVPDGWSFQEAAGLFVTAPTHDDAAGDIGEFPARQWPIYILG